MMKKILTLLTAFLCAVTMMAQTKDAIGRKKGAPENWFVVGKTTKLYEQPSVKGDVAISMKGAEIVAEPGMVFRVVSDHGVWTKVEYMTGINAFISNDARAANDRLTSVVPGEYHLTNSSGSVKVAATDERRYTLTTNGKEFRGRKVGKFLVFKDNTGNIAYTLVDTGNDVIAYDYLQLGW